jgi:hypothetical protein
VVVVLGVKANEGFAEVRRAGLSLPDAVEPLYGAPSLSPPGVYSNWTEAVRYLTKAREIADRGA